MIEKEASVAFIKGVFTILKDTTWPDRKQRWKDFISVLEYTERGECAGICLLLFLYKEHSSGPFRSALVLFGISLWLGKPKETPGL